MRWLFYFTTVIMTLWPDVTASAQTIGWTGKGSHRIIVKVAPRDIGKRPHDELPAELEINVEQLLMSTSAIDVSSLQVIQFDPSSGQPIPYNNYAHGKSTADRPFRWYDASIPYDFPEFADTVDRTGGKLTRKPVVRGGYYYNAIGNWKSGRLAWLHTQHSHKSSHYAIYFDLLPSAHKPTAAPPRGWLGDGLMRCDASGSPAVSADHARIDLDDWNNDGLIDIILGEHYGHLFIWLNSGTKNKPQFTHSRFMVDSAGVPIDAGAGSTPKVVDWNGDGKKDLLVGAEWNRVLLFLNQGTNAERKLKYAGLLMADNQALQLPITPLERGSEKIFRRDYYPVLETADWDGDGDFDLLAGGYITGRIFFYENTGRGNNGLPKLILRGPLQANGKPLNVQHWCAAPCVADFDNDGDLDVMSGSLPMTMSSADSIGNPAFLRYYKNVGTKVNPRLSEVEFPVQGKMPTPRLATPRAADWDGDGDLDLIVSARESIFLYENKGSATQPRFSAPGESLTYRWGASPIPADQFLDFNNDGLVDIFVRGHYSVRLNSGGGNPWSWDEEIPILPPGKRIEHPTGMGDDWFWPFLDDFDQDGQIDVLFGDWHGHVWFHRNLDSSQRKFDFKGKQLKLKSGKLIKVGPIGKDPKTDFDALQGGRPTLTVADFDRDGQKDLVIGDTYGKVRYYRQAKGKATMTFAEPVLIGNLGIRLLVDSADWNNDGWPDVIAGAANGRVRVFLNQGKAAPGNFGPGFAPGLPPIPQPRVLMVDLNGDGDKDLFLPSTQGSCFVERSFLGKGYAKGKFIRAERKNAP